MILESIINNNNNKLYDSFSGSNAFSSVSLRNQFMETQIFQVSISSTFYEELFCTKVFWAAFLYLFGTRKLTQKLLIKCWSNFPGLDVRISFRYSFTLQFGRHESGRFGIAISGVAVRWLLHLPGQQHHSKQQPSTTAAAS